MAASLLLYLVSLVLCCPSTSSKPDTTMVLASNFTKLPTPKSYQSSDQFASTSLIRGRILKQQKSSFFSHNKPFYPLIPFSFGTPPQTLNFLIDTGDSLSWFPCGSTYTCYNCFNCTKDPSKIKTFNPSLSSSSKYVGCDHPPQYHESTIGTKDKCESCDASNPKNCSERAMYEVEYLEGFTKGYFLSETLNLQEKHVSNFIVGCSLTSSHPPNGNAGFSRGLLSFPTQLGIRKFHYCFSGTQPKHSYFGWDEDSNFQGRLSYVPFLKSPSHIVWGKYYVVLTDIVIGTKSIPIQLKFLWPDNDGNGGTIFDSGSSFTIMERSIFQTVVKEFHNQLVKDDLVVKMESTRFCFNVSSGFKANSIPKMKFLFKGGATMKLHSRNYLMEGNEKGFVCLSIEPKHLSTGPAIVLGVTQQRDFHIEYDLENGILGFQADMCIRND